MNSYKSANARSIIANQAVEELLREFDCDTPPSLAMVFASPHYVDQLPTIATLLQQGLQTANIMGCTGESIVCDGQEIEDDPCISIWAAWWPNATVELSHVRFEREDGSFERLPTMLGDDSTSAIVLADPFSFPADVLLAQLNERIPGTSIAGGMASGGTQPGDARLIFGDTVLDEGAVVAALKNTQMQSVVSQGCRPIGEPFVITKAERNVVLELGGKRAHDQLKLVYDRLPTRDKDLMRMGLHMGRVVNEYQDSFDHGDFLIRNVTGFYPEDGSISLGDFYRVGQTVQFHLRDAASASQDLETLLNRGVKDQAAKGALLFTCNGRGTRLFEDPHHDAAKIQQIAGNVPCAGFFCAGEIGPISGENFLHGFTASAALFP